MRRHAGWLVILSAALSLAGCGGAAASGPHEPRDATGVRENMYAFYRDERTGNAVDACATMTKQAQAELVKEQKASSCPAAQFTVWNSPTGTLSQAQETKINERSLTKLEGQVARAKILVVGDHATAINPLVQKTEEYVYTDGRWLFANTSPSNAPAEMKKEAEEQEAQNQAAITAGEAEHTNHEIQQAESEQVESSTTQGTE
jgi:hypothetical protein